MANVPPTGMRVPGGPNQKGCSPILKSAVITSTGRSGTRVKPVPVPGGSGLIFAAYRKSVPLRGTRESTQSPLIARCVDHAGKFTRNPACGMCTTGACPSTTCRLPLLKPRPATPCTWMLCPGIVMVPITAPTATPGTAFRFAMTLRVISAWGPVPISICVPICWDCTTNAPKYLLNGLLRYTNSSGSQ